MIKGLLAVVGLTLLSASVARAAAPLIVLGHATAEGWLRYGHALGRVAVVAPTSEPVGLLFLGIGFVLVAYQIRQKR